MDEWIAIARDAAEIPWVRAVLTVLASLVAAKIVDLIITQLLLRAAARTSTDFDDRLIQLVHRPIFISVVLLGIHTAVKALDWGGGAEQIVGAVIQTLALFVWIGAAWKLIHETLAGLSRLADRVTWVEARTLPLLDNLSKLVVFGLGVYGFLIVWGLDLSAWLASAGIMGIAVGFAAKDSLANLFGGIFVIMDSPYKLGDYINLDSGERGQVVKIGLRSTRLLTRDDVEITLPNAHIANSKVINETGGPHEKIRVMVNVGVAYGSDIDRVHEVLLEAARSVASVVDDPEPYVRFIEMGDSALLFRVQGWIDEPALRGRCIDGLNSAIYKALGAADIEIPFPQRVVHLAQPLPPPA
jgi:small-conductance mechanosensitive channel